MQTAVRVLFSILLFLAASLLSVSVPLPAGAQTPGARCVGTIFDPQDNVLAGAEIVAEPVRQRITSNGETKRAVSTDDGSFSLNLVPGQYRITISRDSFAAVEQKITVAVGETRHLQVHLTLEPLSSKVDVTAESIPLEADASPAPVTIVTRQEIEQRDATSLPDLLATLPGLSLARTGAEGNVTTLFLDGGNSNYTKVLVDGAPVNQPGGLVDFSNFTLDNVDKIEVVHGAESALYGSDAMVGVIQIFTHHGTTRAPEYDAFAEGGNFATGRGGADLSGLVGKFDYSAGVADLQTQGQGPNDAFRNRTLSGNFGWAFSDTTRVRLVLRDNNSDAGAPGQTLLLPPNLTDHSELHNFNATLHVELQTGSRWHHQLNGTEFYNREFIPDPFFSTFDQYNRAAFSGQSTYQYKTVVFTAGYEYEVENGFVGIHARRNNQAGFLDARWRPIKRLTFSAGARAEDDAQFGTRVVPRVGATYALRMARGAIGDTRLHGFYGEGIVESPFFQSFSTSDPCFPGNPHLLPEQSRSVHAGIDQDLISGRVSVSLDYFDNQFRDIVSFGAVSSPSMLPGCSPQEFNENLMSFGMGGGTYFNTDLARARGGNLSVKGRLNRWLTAIGSYTYDPTRVLVSPNATDLAEIPGNRLLRRPVNSGNITLNAAFKRMNWNISGYFTGVRTDSDFFGDGVTSNPGYARFDFAGAYNIGRGVSVYGRVTNLTNKLYQDALGYPALGREFRIGMKYTSRRE